MQRRVTWSRVEPARAAREKVLDVDEPRRRLVLVTGAGRSGTSTMAGALHLLGHHLPRPVLQANESNPKGFFESRWPVRFHKRLLERATVEQTDGRPVAHDLVAAQVGDDTRRELRDWLGKQLAQADDVMVKDPRAAWVPQLWAQEAAGLDATPVFVTMLRAPVEVVRSRGSHYAANRPWMDESAFAVMNLAGWVNANLVVERHTREQARAFVRYDDLRSDWRAVMRGLRDDLGVRLDHPLTDEPHAEVDAFIEPSLNRSQGTWEGLDLPAELVDLAEELDELLGGLADAHGHDAATEARIDDLASRYAALYRRSQAIAVDHAVAHGRVERRRGLEQGRREGAQEARDASLPRRIARAARRRFPM
jgi:hypothetical protein